MSLGTRLENRSQKLKKSENQISKKLIQESSVILRYIKISLEQDKTKSKNNQETKTIRINLIFINKAHSWNEKRKKAKYLTRTSICVRYDLFQAAMLVFCRFYDHYTDMQQWNNRNLPGLLLHVQFSFSRFP